MVTRREFLVFLNKKNSSGCNIKVLLDSLYYLSFGDVCIYFSSDLSALYAGFFALLGWPWGMRYAGVYFPSRSPFEIQSWNSVIILD